MNTGYSQATSLPAYHCNQNQKQLQKEYILESIRKWGSTCLLRISEETGVPQSSCSGRVNDLISENKVEYSGYCSYKNRLRKKIIMAPVQGKLF